MRMDAGVGMMLPQPRNTWGYQKLEEARKSSLLEALEREHSLANTLISDFQSLELQENTFLLF